MIRSMGEKCVHMDNGTHALNDTEKKEGLNNIDLTEEPAILVDNSMTNVATNVMKTRKATGIIINLLKISGRIGYSLVTI